MNVLQYIVGSLILVLAIGLIVMIILQQGKRKGLENVSNISATPVNWVLDRVLGKF